MDLQSFLASVVGTLVTLRDSAATKLQYSQQATTEMTSTGHEKDYFVAANC